jgi:hypothetical protein
VTIYPGDPQDAHRRRRGIIRGVQSILLLPAQGAWLAAAIARGGVWWVAWALVLAALVGAIALTARHDRARDLRARPVVITSLLVTEVVALGVGLVVWGLL